MGQGACLIQPCAGTLSRRGDFGGEYMVEIYTAVQPQSRIRLALPNEVEVDLETNCVRNAEQHRDARLLHLDVVERERRRG